MDALGPAKEDLTAHEVIEVLKGLGQSVEDVDDRFAVHLGLFFELVIIRPLAAYLGDRAPCLKGDAPGDHLPDADQLGLQPLLQLRLDHIQGLPLRHIVELLQGFDQITYHLKGILVEI